MISNIIIPILTHHNSAGAIATNAKFALALYIVSFIFLILPSIILFACRYLKEYNWRKQHGRLTDFKSVFDNITDSFFTALAFILIIIYIGVSIMAAMAILAKLLVIIME